MMSFSTLPASFWRYALETIGYLLNMVPFKSSPLTLMEIQIDVNLVYTMFTYEGAQHTR